MKTNSLFACILVLGGGIAAIARADGPDASGPPRIRLVVLTDITSLTAGVIEPDDGQSLIRLMLYSNEFDIEGLIATSNLEHGRRTRPDLIHQVIDAYEEVRPNLLLHDPRYPTAAALRATVHDGQPAAGRKVAVEESIGADRDTDASRALIRIVDRDDPRPVHVVVWGGPADLAQALWRVREDRTPAGLARFLAKLRVRAITDQDSTSAWIRDQFPDLAIVTQRMAFRGMYRGGDVSLAGPEWVESNIHGHGALGDLYPSYNGGDPWAGRLGSVRGIKEGDTPSFLALIPNGLADSDHPHLATWGGRSGPGPDGTPSGQVDVVDFDRDGQPGDIDPRMASVYRWRPDFQADFAARLDWCVQPFDRANHAPVVRVTSPLINQDGTSALVTLSARDSTDPDGDTLSFAWALDPSEMADRVTIEKADSADPTVLINLSRPGGTTVPLLLTVRDNGSPRLTRYRRVFITIR
jgi:hypothetical protein